MGARDRAPGAEKSTDGPRACQRARPAGRPSRKVHPYVKRRRSRAQRPARRDPYAEREARRYERPIPSREFILETLRAHGGPMDEEALAGALGLTEPRDLVALGRRLAAMERDGQLVRNRRGAYVPVDHTNLVRGRVVGHPDGFGFLIPDEGGGEDVFIPPRQMRALMHGDRAVVRIAGVDRRGRRIGEVVEVLERAVHRVVGRYFEESGIGFVVPDNKRLAHDIVVPPEARGGARPGQIVVVEITEPPTFHSQPIGRVAEVVGEHMAPGMEIDIAIRAHDIPHEWPPEVLAEAAAFGETVPEEAKTGRVDLRGIELVTIDGEDARDFDDAVWCERRGEGFRLIVAIADVSWYVRPGSALDAEAERRGNSVYFPERVIPMLPEALSNGLCSLNPEVDRLCMACEMLVGRDGQIRRARFFDAVMRSAARLTYERVAAAMEDGDRGERRRLKALLPRLEALYALYRVLRRARERRGAIDFETTETKIVFGPDRRIERIVPVVRRDAHRLIEECMIAANVAAARRLLRARIPALYRVHEGPEAEKLADVRAFLAELGLRLGGGDEPQPRHYAQLLRRIQDRPDRHLIEQVLLRSLKQAVYSPDNVGHFGLAVEAYTHFTSPIRRYPDLLVHRALRHLIARRPVAEFECTHERLVALGDHCSMTERRADEATRDAVDWLKCEYMMDKVGEAFDGLVTGVTSFGLFVELDGIHAQGLVHVTTLGDDYFQFDPVGHRLVGERTGRVYQLADRVRVRVLRVDLDERQIDFELVEDRGPAVARERESRRGGRGRRRRR